MNIEHRILIMKLQTYGGEKNVGIHATTILGYLFFHSTLNARSAGGGQVLARLW
jgi:hypothetical protein